MWQLLVASVLLEPLLAAPRSHQLQLHARSKRQTQVLQNDQRTSWHEVIREACSWPNVQCEIQILNRKGPPAPPTPHFKDFLKIKPLFERQAFLKVNVKLHHNLSRQQPRAMSTTLLDSSVSRSTSAATTMSSKLLLKASLTQGAVTFYLSWKAVCFLEYVFPMHPEHYLHVAAGMYWTSAHLEHLLH